MSGGGGSTTTQKADPWSGVQPYLQSLYSRTNDLMGQGGPQVAQNNGVAGFTPYTQGVMNDITSFTNGNAAQNGQASLANQFADQNGTMGNQYYRNLMSGAAGGQSVLANAMNGNDQTAATYANALSGKDATTNYYANVLGGGDSTAQYLSKVMGGGYLNGNPGLTAAMDAANADTTRNFQTAVMPQLASQFSLAGRYGSGAQSQGVSDATNNLAHQISQTNAGIMNQNYQNERGLQNQAATTLSGLQSNAASGLGNYLLNNAGAAGNYRTGAANSYLGSQTTGAQGLSSNQQVGLGALQQAYQNNVNNLNMRSTVSDAYQQQAQNVLSGNNALYNANQQQPYQNLNWVNGILNGSMALNSQTATQSPGISKLGGALGGAASGALAGSAFGPVGAGVGAVGGALISVL